MLSTKKKMTAALSLTLAGAFALAGCSSSAAPEGGNMSEGGTQSQAPMESASPEASSPSMDPAANLVGPGCADYASAVPDGDGSVAGMAKDPVAVAASNNPLLKTLTAAVSGQLNKDVNLVDTLNGDQFTVFAPVDEAFAKIPAATIDGLKTDSKTLTKILTYHVVPGQIAPDEIDGTHKTVEGQDLKVTGSGDELMVNDAKVICGGVQTANATVYLIDSVLMPPM
ncbi:fasciclin domain-containing protein [Microbacterium sp. MM2322]|uniref:fasciclin domain-containing protein n=1 Tax=Microbacterium sp. MM2322 TaxID=3157631 RepID=UPI0032D58613